MCGLKRSDYRADVAPDCGVSAAVSYTHLDVYKRQMRSRRRFGGALEPMTHVQARYAERPKQELVRLDAFEILSSPLSGPVDLSLIHI